MDHLGTNPTAPLDTHSAPEPSAGSIHQSSQAPPPSPALAEQSLDHFHGWKTISEQGSYDEEGFLYPSCNLTCEKLKDRKEDDVVIFNYSLSRADGDPPVEESGPSSGSPSEIDNIFFQVSKDKLIEPEQFNQVLNPTKQPRPIQSQGPWLAIIDFPQCYDTYDDNLLNSMAKELHLPNPATFGHAHSKRVLTLPGRGMFRTGFSFRVHSKNPSGLAKPGSLEDRITLFVSFPYFGKSSGSIPLGPGSESVELLDFKRLGFDAPDRSAAVSVGDKNDLGEILVHQARYMIFDNCTMATFRSREDSAKDQVPLHRFQERIGAFGAMIQMIANRMDSEPWTLGKLQASLCKLEEDIDQMMSDAETYGDSQGMESIPCDRPHGFASSMEIAFTMEERLGWDKAQEEARQNRVLERKERRARGLLTSLNRLSANLFAAISVAERQVAVLQDLHSLFMTRGQAKTKDREGGYPLRQNSSLGNNTPTLILSKNPEQIWQGDSAAIDEAVRERKCFVKKFRELVENMDVRRKILSAFLKSDWVKAAPSGGTPQGGTRVMECILETLQQTYISVVQQGQVVDGFTLMTIAFLPLNFSASYFGMQTIKEFGGNTSKISLRQFWLTTGPLVAGILLLAVIIILRQREGVKFLKYWAKRKLGLLLRKM